VQKLTPSPPLILKPSQKLSPEWSNVRILLLYCKGEVVKPSLKKIPFVPPAEPSNALINKLPLTSSDTPDVRVAVPMPTLPVL
jgi:hypothetical protein